MEHVEEQQDQTEPESCHCDCIEEGRSRHLVEVGHFNADESDQIGDNYYHLHYALLGSPI